MIYQLWNVTLANENQQRVYMLQLKASGALGKNIYLEERSMHYISQFEFGRELFLYTLLAFFFKPHRNIHKTE